MTLILCHVTTHLAQATDIVYLNISGDIIATKRATLQLCPASALARKYDADVWSQAKWCLLVMMGC